MGVTLEQVVTVRLHLKRETIQDVSHWACGWEDGRVGGRLGVTLELVVTMSSPTDRNHTRHESLGVWVGGRARW